MLPKTTLFPTTLLLALCLTQTYPKNILPKTIEMPVYKINLEDSFEDQIAPVLADKIQPLLKFTTGFKRLLKKGKGPYRQIWASNLVAEHFDRDYVNEMMAYSKLSGVDFVTLLNMNFFAEIFCVCISVIMQTPDGRILHGRNLDFHSYQHELMQLVYQADYYENGKHLFSANKVLGVVGAFSGYKPGKFVVNAIQGNLDHNLILNYHASMQRNGFSAGYLIRKILRYAENYDQAKETLKKAEINAVFYFTLTGVRPGQAVSIKKSRNQNTEIIEMSAKKNGTDWYLIQGCYEEIQIPDFTAEYLVRKHGAGISNQFFLDEIVSFYQVRREITIWTTVAEPRDGWVKTYLWKRSGDWKEKT